MCKEREGERQCAFIRQDIKREIKKRERKREREGNKTRLPNGFDDAWVGFNIARLSRKTVTK